MWLNVIGWTATAVFSSSYFFKEAATLRRIQAMAAPLWVLYGILIHSAPVVVANLIVGVAAVYTSLRLVLNKKPLQRDKCGQPPAERSKACLVSG